MDMLNSNNTRKEQTLHEMRVSSYYSLNDLIRILYNYTSSQSDISNACTFQSTTNINIIIESFIRRVLCYETIPFHRFQRIIQQIENPNAHPTSTPGNTQDHSWLIVHDHNMVSWNPLIPSQILLLLNQVFPIYKKPLYETHCDYFWSKHGIVSMVKMNVNYYVNIMKQIHVYETMLTHLSASGYYHILQMVFQPAVIQSDLKQLLERMVRAAATNADIHTINWILSISVPKLNDEMDENSNPFVLFGKYMAESAAKSGNLPMLQWVCASTMDDGTRDIINPKSLACLASGSGQLHVLQWLLQQYGAYSVFTPRAAALAAHGKHWDTLQWLIVNKCPMDRSVIEQAVIVTDDIMNIQRVIAMGVPWSNNVLSYAVRGGNYNVLNYIYEQFSNIYPSIQELLPSLYTYVQFVRDPKRRLAIEAWLASHGVHKPSFI